MNRELLESLPCGAGVVRNVDGTPDGMVLELTEKAMASMPWIRKHHEKNFGSFPDEYRRLAPIYMRVLETGKSESMGMVEKVDEDIHGWFAVEAGKMDEETVAIFFINVTEVALEKIAYERAAKQAQDMNEKFMRALAHDLKEPCRTVSQFTELLLTHWDKMDDDRRQDFMGRAHRGALKLGEMIDRLRSLILELNGNGSVPSRPIRYVVSDAIDGVQGAIDETKAEIMTSIDVPDGYAVSMSVSNVIQNLLDNSMKYSGEEAPHVDMTVVYRDGELFVEVADKGMGFDPLDSDTVFEPFRRLYPQNEKPGLGMGLAICREIIERKGGSMVAHSPGVGEGATVSFRVPVREVDDDQDTPRGGQ